MEERHRLTDADVESVPSTEAKNVFGSLLDKAIAGKTVVITRRKTPKAVLVGIEEYESLIQGEIGTLDALSRAFDERLEAMQSPKARAAAKSAFNASPKRLARGAVKAARTRG